MRKEVEKVALQGPTLVIDGKCNLCHTASGFIAARAAEEFLFMWAQHPDTVKLLNRHFQVSAEDIMQSWALILDGKIYRGANAWLEATTFMKQPWKTLGRVGWIFPQCLRDAVYGFVASNRYTMFGGSDICRRPDAGCFLHDVGEQ